MTKVEDYFGGDQIKAYIVFSNSYRNQKHNLEILEICGVDLCLGFDQETYQQTG